MSEEKLVSREDIYNAFKNRVTPREFKHFKKTVDSILDVVDKQTGLGKAKGWLAGWKAAVKFGAGLYYHEVEVEKFIDEGLRLMEIAADEENPAILGL